MKYIFKTKPSKQILKEDTKELLHEFKGNPSKEIIVSHIDTNYPYETFGCADDVWIKFLNENTKSIFSYVPVNQSYKETFMEFEFYLKIIYFLLENIKVKR